MEARREGRRPARTVYQLPDAGRVKLDAWMSELLSTPVKEYPQFEAALSLMPVLHPDTVLDLLRLRTRALEKEIGGGRPMLRPARKAGVPPPPPPQHRSHPGPPRDRPGGAGPPKRAAHREGEQVLAAPAPAPAVREIRMEGNSVSARADEGATAVPGVLAALETAGIPVRAATVARPSLDDVYLRYAGRRFAEADQSPAVPAVSGGSR